MVNEYMVHQVKEECETYTINPCTEGSQPTRPNIYGLGLGNVPSDLLIRNDVVEKKTLRRRCNSASFSRTCASWNKCDNMFCFGKLGRKSYFYGIYSVLTLANCMKTEVKQCFVRSQILLVSKEGITIESNESNRRSMGNSRAMLND